MARIRAVIFSILMAVVLLFGCVYAPRQSETPSDVPAPPSKPEKAASAQSLEPSFSAPAIARLWRSEIQLTIAGYMQDSPYSDWAPNEVHTQASPHPTWATKMIEIDENVYYITEDGVKCVSIKESEATLLYRSNDAYRIFFYDGFLYIWELEETAQQKDQKTAMVKVDLQTGEAKVIWETAISKLLRGTDEQITEIAVHEGRVYFYNQNFFLSFSYRLGDTLSDLNYIEIKEDGFIYYVGQEALLEGKAYYFSMKENVGWCLMEVDLQKNTRRVVRKVDPVEAQFAKLAAYKGKLYSSFVEEMGVCISVLDPKNGEVLQTVANIRQYNIDFIIEESGLYFVTSTDFDNQSTLYKVDETNMILKHMGTLPRRRPSVRIIADTIFYGTEKATTFMDIEK